MRGALHLGLGVLIISQASAIAVSALDSESPGSVEAASANKPSRFEHVLDQVNPVALHQALHKFSPAGYKHGTFKQDKDAAEALLNENPAIATSFIRIAKRQITNGTGNGNNANDPSTDTSSTTPSSPPVVTTTTTEGGGGSNNNNNNNNNNNDNPPVRSTRTIIETSTSIVQPAAVAGQTQAPAAAEPTQTTPAAAEQGGSGGGDSGSAEPTAAATQGDDGSSSSSGGSSDGGDGGDGSGGVALKTITLPDGERSTITSVTVVPGHGATAAASGGASATSKKASLQSHNAAAGSVPLREGRWLGVLGGMVGVVMVV